MAGFTNPYSKPTSAGQNPYAAPSRPQASAAQPGQAQSIPPKPQGTPYQSSTQQAQSAPSKPQGTPYQAYSQGGQSAAGGYQGFGIGMGRPTLRPASQQVTGDWQGGYASAAPEQRPPAFQAGPAQTPWGQSADPFADRNAFINQINQQRMQNQIAFNSSGPTNPADQMTPGINYQQAMQQAGLGGGSPSMSSDYGDSLIQRLNQSFAGQGNPFANPQSPAQQFAGIYAPGADITKLPFTDTMQPNPAYRPPASLPGWSPSNDSETPRPDGGAFWGSPDGKSQPIKPPAQVAPYQPFVNQQGQQFQGTMSFAPGTPQAYQNQAYGNYANQQGYFQQPTSSFEPQKVSNREQFLQNRAAGRGGYQATTYGDYVNAGLDAAVGQALNSPTGKEWYSQYQSADPAKKQAYGERLKNLIYSTAAQRGVAPEDSWLASKTGKAAPAAKDQYFNEAIGRYESAQSKRAADGKYQEAMSNQYLRGPYDPQGRVKFLDAMQRYYAAPPTP